MGTGSSLLRNNHEDDIEYNDGRGVIKRIPDEVKPRQKLGRLGLRSVSSLGKNKASSSLRSALSVDDEDPEVSRIRKDFEMFRLNKENEFANMQRRVQKCEKDNRRLRTELQTSSKTCQKLREQRDNALGGERDALIRASAFETNRDKIQRQFKIFRETKESEIQNLLRAKRELEAKLAKYGHAPLEDSDSSSKLELSIAGGGSGEWWMHLESEPSLASTTQLNLAGTSRGPEFAYDMMEVDGPYVNVNKEDWHQAAASLSHILPTIPDSAQINTIRVFISAPRDVQKEVNIFTKEFGPKLKKMCGQEGRFFNVICMPYESDSNHSAQFTLSQARNHQIEQATVFVCFLAQYVNRFTENDINNGHLNNPGGKPAVFCFRNVSDKSKGNFLEVMELKRRVKESGRVKIFENYETPREGVELLYEKLVQIINIELGVDDKHNAEEVDDLLDGPEALCGGCLWDINQDYEQMEYLSDASRSSCELGFEKYYDRLSAHVSAAGPLPPLLVSSAPGQGKSLLLAKWIELHQQRSNSGLVLYHFVGSRTSCNADPLVMIRRFTSQLLQHVSSFHSLTCDPVRLSEEFPKWLEKVSSKVSGGVVLVLDSADHFQNGESQLKWLLDPLPVDARVIISCDESTCPLSWKSWPTLRIGEFTNKNVKELLRAELATFSMSISPENESKILTYCRTPQTANPLYVVVLASDLAKCGSLDLTRAKIDERMEARINLLLQSDNVGLYRVLLEHGRRDFEQCSQSDSLIVKALKLIYASRNGLSEAELFEITPALTWNHWTPIVQALMHRHIITLRSGLLIFAHRQSRQAVEELYLSQDSDQQVRANMTLLRGFFSRYTMPGDATYRVADELPWLTRQLGDKDELYECIVDLCIFVKLYGRGRCAELIGYWQYLGVDKISMSQAYYRAMKQMEGMVGQFNGLVTLPRIADVYEALGRFLKDLNLLSEALTPLQRALEIRETCLDPDHPSVGQSLHQMAGLYTQQGKLSTAEDLYKQALEIFEGAFGSEHFLMAREIDSLALLYQKQGKHELAEPMHKKAVAMRKRVQTPRQNTGQMRSVDPLRRRALQLEELIMGADSADLARTLNEIGVLYYLQNNIQTAESYFKRSIEMRESIFGSDHPEVAQSLNNLAALYFDRKQYQLAVPLYEKALQIRRIHFAQDHASVVSVIKHLGMLYKKMGALQKALPLYKEMVSIRERLFGSQHPSVATALVNLAVLHSQQGEHSEALPLYERALSIYEDGLGQAHPRVAETLKNLALLKYEQGDMETAASMYKRATDIKEQDSNIAGHGNFNQAPSVKNSDDSASTLRNTHPLHMDND